METEQGLYAQVIMLRQKYLKFVATGKNKNEAKFKFQGQSARLQRWFDLDFDCIEVNFTTREPNIYKKFFKSMMIHKIQIHLKAFKFQYEMKILWNHLSITVMPQSSSIIRIN